jgi:anti-sigma factor RsiW
MSDRLPQLSDPELAELCALADGTLPEERRAEVEARLASSPELRQLVDRQLHALRATRMLEDEPVPDSLRAAVESERQGRASGGRARGRRFVPRAALAGAVVVAAAVAAAIVLTGGPGAPTVAEAAEVALQSPTGPAPSEDGPGRLSLDVDGVAFPDFLHAYGWKAVGVRRDEIDGREATTVVYEKDGRRIGYVIVSGDGLARPDAAQSTTDDGVLYQTFRVDDRLVVTWRRLGHTCILIGPAPAEELLALAGWDASQA